jgi:hypothetical protein
LLADRLSMAVAFAGVLGLAAASSISDRAGAALAGFLFVAGPAAAAWAYSGNVLPWVVVQFGGMPLILWCALRGPRAGGLPVGWFAVLLAYAVAKLFEANDAQVFSLTGQWLGGHAIKHVVAALAALPVIAPLAALARRHNPANTLAARA